MGRGANVLCCSWVAIYVATVASVSLGQTTPATAPTTEPIAQVNLDDPILDQSLCYLDLGDGKTYRRGELLPDAMELRHWINERGINLECETRPPVEGLVIYDLALTPIDKSFDSTIDYAAVRDQLQPIEPRPFELIKVSREVPKTFAFRTRQNVLGVFEVSARTDSKSGLRVRYKLLHAPPLPVIVHSPLQGELAALAARIQTEKQLLQNIDPSQAETIKVVQSAIDTLQQQITVFTREPDWEIAVDRTWILSSQHLIDSFAGQLTENDPFIGDTKRRIAALTLELTVLERTRNLPAERKAGMLKLRDDNAKQHGDDLVKRYDDAHPVVDASLKELSRSEKMLREQKSYIEEQLAHASQGKQSVERLLALQESRGLAGSTDSEALRTQVDNYDNSIRNIKRYQKQNAQLEQATPPRQPQPKPKPATFPAVSNFGL